MQTKMRLVFCAASLTIVLTVQVTPHCLKDVTWVMKNNFLLLNIFQDSVYAIKMVFFLKKIQLIGVSCTDGMNNSFGKTYPSWIPDISETLLIDSFQYVMNIAHSYLCSIQLLPIYVYLEMLDFQWIYRAFGTSESRTF